MKEDGLHPLKISTDQAKFGNYLDSPIHVLKKKTQLTTKNKCSLLLSSLYTELFCNTTLLKKSYVEKSLKGTYKKTWDNFLNYEAVTYLSRCKQLVTISHKWKKDSFWIFLFVTTKLFSRQKDCLEHMRWPLEKFRSLLANTQRGHL